AARLVVGHEPARRALSATGGAGGGRGAARSVLCRAEENPAALPRVVLPLQRRRRGAPLQPAADRCRPHQGIVASHCCNERGSGGNSAACESRAAPCCKVPRSPPPA